MLKSKWILALFLIILAAACGEKPSPPGSVADTPENRKIAAKRYLELVSPQELLRNITASMAQRVPEQHRKQFQEAMEDKELQKNVSRITEEGLAKHFSPDEINAMAVFFGSPAGKSARAKFAGYTAETMPQVNDEVRKVLVKMQEQIKKDEEKEGPPKAAEQPKPEPPKAASPKPEPEKPSQPETQQPKPEKPEVKQPQPEKPQK